MRLGFYERDGSPLRGVDIEQEIDPAPDVPRFHVRRTFSYHDDARGDHVRVPDNFETDLASVPWVFWWVVASYGRHTAAAIVHDVLIDGNSGVEDRRKADGLFFRALEASGSSWFRHRLMFVGVSVGGTMWQRRKLLTALFFAHALAFWAAAVAALAWRPLMLAVAAALGLAGFLWTFTPTAEREYAWWLWAVAAAAILLVVPPILVMLFFVELIAIVDRSVALGRYALTRRWVAPSPHPMYRTSALRLWSDTPVQGDLVEGAPVDPE